MTINDFKKEADHFYSFLFKHYQVLSSNPENECSLKENNIHYRGWDLVCKGKTLVCRFIVTDLHDPSTWILSLTIYNLKWGIHGMALDSRQLPMNSFPIDEHSLHHVEHSFSEKDGKLLWTEYIQDDKSHSTNQLVHDWVQKLISK